MLILETLLLTTLTIMLTVAGYTDCSTSLIKNKHLIISSSILLVLDIMYYAFFAPDYLFSFAVNLIFLVAISFFFYAYHLWAAGDSKLLFVVGLGIPGRYYTFWEIGHVSSFVIVIFIFSIAFIYVIAESFIMGIRYRNLLKFTVGKVDYPRAITSYFAMVVSITIVNWLLWSLFPSILGSDLILSQAVSFLVVLSLIQLRDKLSTKIIATIAIVGWGFELTMAALGLYRIQMSFDMKTWGVVLILLVVRLLAEKYNYQTVPTSTVKAGQILSAATIISFATSKIRGLPKGTTEDLRSRLSSDEADSVRRWENSQQGKPFVIIVRKMPFAIFIGIGVWVFLALGVMMK